MSIDLMRLGGVVQLVTPTAVAFLDWIGFLGCFHPVYMRVWRIGTISLAVMNNPSSSSSASEDIMHLIFCTMVRIGSL